MRVGMDQTTAWIVSVVVAASLFGVGALVVSGMAGHAEHGGEIDSHGAMPHEPVSDDNVLRADEGHGAEHGGTRESNHGGAGHESGGHPESPRGGADQEAIGDDAPPPGAGHH